MIENIEKSLLEVDFASLTRRTFIHGVFDSERAVGARIGRH
jgi:hypothetical protein